MGTCAPGDPSQERQGQVLAGPDKVFFTLSSSFLRSSVVQWLAGWTTAGDLGSIPAGAEYPTGLQF